jgi:glycosyltransferase involved in cell wall biosynthesis
MNIKKVVFVIPTKDEETTIEKIIIGLRLESKKNNLEILSIIVADDSVDSTRSIAKSLGADIIDGGGRGLGEAMYRGLKSACELDTDYIVSVDADGQTEITELGNLVHPLQNNTADMILTSRRIQKDLIKYKYPLINRFGVIVLVWLLRRGTGLEITDSHGGLRAMRKEVAKKLHMIGIHTYVQETILDAHQNNFKIIEIPGEWKERAGESRVLASIPKYIILTLPVILLKMKVHLYVFIPLFVTIFVMGLICWVFGYYSFLSGLMIGSGIIGISASVLIGYIYHLSYKRR